MTEASAHQGHRMTSSHRLNKSLAGVSRLEDHSWGCDSAPLFSNPAVQVILFRIGEKP